MKSAKDKWTVLVCLLVNVSVVLSGWSPWGQFTQCSRSCDGGVKYRERICVVDRLDRSVCKGKKINYKICNTHACGGVTRDFRAEQCARYNDQPLDGTLYSWGPYYGDGETCQLRCFAKNFPFYHKFADKVIDGTPCLVDEYRRCIDGHCKYVGCDRKIGSKKRLDICGVCGGDNSTCIENHRAADVTGVFDQTTLSPGHTTIVEIPVGATHIYVRELGPNKNSIVFWDNSGQNFAIDTETRKVSPSVYMAGTTFIYNAVDKGNTYGGIQATGPTDSVITVYAANEGAKNPGIRYGYNLQYDKPKTSASTHAEEKQGRLPPSELGPSNFRVAEPKVAEPAISSIGNIKVKTSHLPAESRRTYGISNVRVVDRSSVDSLHSRDNGDDNAYDARKFVYANNVQVFGGDNSITETEFEEGTQDTRNSDRGRVLSTKIKSGELEPERVREPVTPDDNYDAYRENEIGYLTTNSDLEARRLHDRRLGNDNNLDIGGHRSVSPERSEDRYMWSYGHWTECSSQCGTGVQRRIVSCVDRVKRESTEEKYCHGNKRPSTSQPCSNGDCRSDSPSSYVRWQVGSWGECSTSCEIGDQIQDVFCEAVYDDGTSKRVDDEQCLTVYQAKPQYRRSCNDGVPCQGPSYKWTSSDWRQCSVTCGEGVQSRRIDCRMVGNNGRVRDDECSPDLRPVDRRRCKLAECTVDRENNRIIRPQPDRYMWKSSNWRPCSVTCGEGVQSRRIDCRMVGNNGRVRDDECSPDLRPVDRRRCKLAECTVEREDNRIIRPQPERFTWRSSDWGQCSVTCGDGVQSRRIDCRMVGNNGRVRDDECSPDLRPVDRRRCKLAECTVEREDNRIITPAPDRYMWKFSNWRQCSVTCGEGVQSRRIDCRMVGNNGRVRDDECSPDLRPVDRRRCKLAECTVEREENRIIRPQPERYTWKSSDWGQCSVTCGDGVQSRRIDCRMVGNNGRVRDDECSPDLRPVDRRRCKLAECTIEREDNRIITPAPDRYMWKFSNWRQCSVTCGDGVQSRRIDCRMVGNNGRVRDDECSPDLRPVDRRRCKLAECTVEREENRIIRPQAERFTWRSSDWGQCSVTCGNGVQSRRIDCRMVGNNGRVRDDECSPDLHPVDRRRCKLAECTVERENNRIIRPAPDRYMWKFSNWSQCSVTCGDGVQSRRIDCRMVGNNGRVRDDECSPDLRPVDRRRCKLAECTDEPERVRSTDCRKSRYGCCPDQYNAKRYENDNCMSLDQVLVKTGNRAVLDCNQYASRVRGSAIIEWTKQGLDKPVYRHTRSSQNLHPRYDGRVRSVDKSLLEIYPTYETDSGLYTCTVTLPVGDRERVYSNQIFLDVRENIVITEDDSKTNEKPTTTTTSTEACSQISSQGTCRDFVVKWFYNTSSELCERFWYGGCGGNDNRFEQETECKQACISSEDVCKQPSVTGRCRARHVRWYYNSGRRECMQFIYGGCNGNGNRFRTRIDCERQCLDATEALGDQNGDCRVSRYGCCPDGRTSAAGTKNEGCGLTPCDRTEFGCCDDEVTAAQGPDQEGCEMIEFPSGDGNLCNDTEYGCCPDGLTAAQGPSNAGCQVKTPDVSVPDPDVGFTVDSGEAPAHCQLAKNAGPCSDYNVMWYYNSRSGNCERFWFGGCEGNLNRFKSDKECQAMCQRSVRREPELPVCEQPKEIGPCRAGLRRWFYNDQSGACEMFIYGGCQGNENNFDDQETCERRCGVVRVIETPLTAAQICAQPRDVGPCKAAIQKFYYNADTRRCEQFTYGGCGGNRNNFDTEVRCRQYCRASPPVTTVTEAPQTGKRQPVCELTPALGPCKRMITKYFYNISSAQCEPFTYGGCLGNHNNFETIEKCTSYCGLRTSRARTDDCLMNKQTGQCRGNFRRYYYDSSSGRCLEFSYGGCQGNGNNFMDENTCMSSCHDGRVVEPLTRPPVVRTTRAPPAQETDICSLRLQTPCENRGEGPFWYYDQYSGACKEIPNGECNKNQNNFRSREACEGYCSRSRVCAPLTYQSDIRCLAYMEHWTYNPDTNACEMFVYGGCGGTANNFQNEETCNRKCSIETVEPVTKAPEPTSPEEICAMPEDSGNCLAYIRNWRYDNLQGKCVQFVYGGCGGNDNRFQSEQECERFCNRQVVCQKFEDPEIGCLAYMRRWRYDPDSGNCENFIYGGCGGNANNFDSLEACDQKCSVADPEPEPTRETNSARYSWRDICRLQADVGPCKQFNKRWHYNSISQSCEEFTYGGCLGNHNNFESETQCMTYCDSSRWAQPRPTRPPTTEKPDEVIDESSGEITTVEPATGVDACALDSYTGRCRAYIRSWYYESLTGQCKQFIFGGCDSNGNMFDSQEACDTQCSPRAVCMLPKQSGACMAYNTRYYFDYDAQTCREFVYGGCDGNANNFENMEACENRCATLMRDRVPDTRKYGTCPAMRSPRRGEVCIDQCRRDRDCPGRKKCCSLACSYVCVEPEYRGRIRPVGKTGYCPPKSDWGGLLGACAPQCSDDSSCGGNQKCCHQGCGMKCTDPVGDEPYQLNTPVRVVANTISSDSISVSWYDRALGAEQQSKDNQYYTIRYYSFGLGQYEYMNVTDLNAVVTGLRPDTDYEFNVRVNSPPYLSQWSENTRSRTSTVAVARIGYCPPKTDWEGLLGACAPQCRDDSSCLGNQKCCHHGCGMKCVDTVDEEPYQMNAPVRVVANTVSSDAVRVSWYDPSLAGDQLIRDNRYYTIRYYSFGLGQYEYLNVTELSGLVTGLRADTEYEFNVRVNDPPYLSEWSENTRNRTTPRVVAKSGECPVVSTDTFGICVEECQSDADCNGVQKCCSNGCGQTCVNPTGYDICSLPKDPGSCSDWEVRWYFNSDRRCDRFWYGGCNEGNANNFMDQEDCQNSCIRKVVKPTTASPRPYDCRRTTFGCCLDRYTPRLDDKGSNCAEYEGDNVNRGETLVPAIPGESVTLDCSYGGDVTWYRNGKLVEADSRRTLNPDGTMVVTETNIEDDGLYACHVRVNGGRPTVYSYMLQVRVPIGILPGPEKIMVKPNRQAFLHCEVYGNPKPSVSWSKGSQPLSSEYRYETFRNGTLLIRTASEQDIDRYTCTADNGVNSPVQRTIKLELREMLVARIENDNGRVMEGARIKLTCEGSGYPPPSINWEKMGRPLFTGGNVFISSDGQLTIRNVTTRDTGTYTCIVSNSEEKIETATSVQVVPKVMPDDKCADKTSLMKCRLIVTARLCGYPMYSKICCASCRRYQNGE